MQSSWAESLRAFTDAGAALSRTFELTVHTTGRPVPPGFSVL